MGIEGGVVVVKFKRQLATKMIDGSGNVRFDDGVLQRMKRNSHQNAANFQVRSGQQQRVIYFIQLVVDEQTQCLQ